MNTPTATPPEGSSPAIVHKLARARLKGAIFPPRTNTPEVRLALAKCAYGLRHFEGEHVVAVLNHATGEGDFDGIVLTDRVLLVRYGDDRFVVPLEEIKEAERHESFFSACLKVHTHDEETLELPVVDDAEAIEGLLNGIAEASYRPRGRSVPAVVLGEGDPTGVKHLVGALKAPDDRIVALIQLLHEALEDEVITQEAGRDLVVRVQLLYRTLSYGRGVWQHRWMSPLRYDDLALLIPTIFKHPSTSTSRRGGVEIEVRTKPKDKKKKGKKDKSGGLERKLLNSLIDSVVERTVGDEIYSLLGSGGPDVLKIDVDEGPGTEEFVQREEVKETSVWAKLKGGLPDIADSLLGRKRRADEGALATFTLEGQVAHKVLDLAQLQPEMAGELSMKLLQKEVRGLLLRIIYGWDETPESLMGVTDESLLSVLKGRLSAGQIRALMSTEPIV